MIPSVKPTPVFPDRREKPRPSRNSLIQSAADPLTHPPDIRGKPAAAFWVSQADRRETKESEGMMERIAILRWFGAGALGLGLVAGCSHSRTASVRNGTATPVACANCGARTARARAARRWPAR